MDLELLDRQLLQTINGWNSPFWDTVMYVLTGVWIWIPFFALVIWLLWKHYGKQLTLVLAFCALCIVLTDQGSVWIKNKVQRYRPSQNLEIKEDLHLHQNKDGSIYRGGMYGFVSSHAANGFGIAVLLMYFFKPVSKKWLWVFPLWAMVFCYTRMYLGLHYPADIFCGAVYGILCGCFTIWLYKLSLQQLAKEQAQK